jgi:AraC family transcriptional regulator
VRYVDLQFQPESLASFFSDGRAPRFPIAPRLGFFDARIYGLARIFVNECVGEAQAAPLFGDSLSVSLLMALASLPESSEQSSGGLTPWQLRKATEFLAENMAADIGPAEVAATLGLSRSHFCRSFKASTGLPPHAWLLNQRVERAREMIVEGGRSPVEIALATGFNDQPHFTRAFTRMVGHPPGEWRRRLTSLDA